MEEIEQKIKHALEQIPENTEFTVLELLEGVWPDGWDPRTTGKWFKLFSADKNNNIELIERKSNNHHLYKKVKH